MHVKIRAVWKPPRREDSSHLEVPVASLEPHQQRHRGTSVCAGRRSPATGERATAGSDEGMCQARRAKRDMNRTVCRRAGTPYGYYGYRWSTDCEIHLAACAAAPAGVVWPFGSDTTCNVTCAARPFFSALAVTDRAKRITLSVPTRSSRSPMISQMARPARSAARCSKASRATSGFCSAPRNSVKAARSVTGAKAATHFTRGRPRRNAARQNLRARCRRPPRARRQ